ncbi:malonate decarboxylase subunit alpha [uncultured Phascolarctobacterium sp.]|uniref:malonate decarboxylase subunit alpha n=1 Tax=uncultured Phascolarctobacterium sp. TaxID=512296 RepID=UPI0034554F2A
MRRNRENRLAAACKFLDQGKFVKAEDTVALLEAVIQPYDKVAVEGDNQKQADFLSECLAAVDAARVHDLHIIQSTISLPEHVEIFEKGIAKKLDFSYSGAQSKRLAALLQARVVELGAIHTYLELYARYFVDLTPRVALLVAEKADRDGNLYTGFSTEDTPVIAEAVKFKQGIVIVQVNEITDELPRVDIPGDWVDFIVQAPRPFKIEPLFTKDPALLTDTKILKAMLAIKGIYMEYGIKTLNHGVGFDTAAIELLLPTYGEELGLKGKICTNFVLNPHPTLIPAIESGWVESVHCFGGEVGMDEYVNARSDVFFIGPDGSMRSNRVFAQAAGHYAADLFIGSTLQIDKYGNSSTAVRNRIVGFGGAPNLGCNAGGRRHVTDSWLKCGQEIPADNQLIGEAARGRKLVVQMLDTVSAKGIHGFVDQLDAVGMTKDLDLAIPPVMIYGDDVTHIISEIGIAYLHKCRSLEERMEAISSISGRNPEVNGKILAKMRRLGIVKTPEDLDIDRRRANKELLAAKSLQELVEWSGGLYKLPEKYNK